MKTQAFLLSVMSALATLSANTASAQNFVTNPDFDDSLSGWIQSGNFGGTCSRSSTEGSPSAGSVSCVGAPPSGYSEIVQCLAIPVAKVDASVRIKVTSSGASPVLVPQDAAECGQSGPAGWSMHDEGSVDSTDPDWHLYSLRFIPMATPWVSLFLGSGGDQVFYDHVYLGPSETVSLLALSAIPTHCWTAIENFSLIALSSRDSRSASRELDVE